VLPSDVIIFEGILVFYFKEIRDMFNLKLFVDMDADMRLAQRGTSCLLSINDLLNVLMCLNLLDPPRLFPVLSES